MSEYRIVATERATGIFRPDGTLLYTFAPDESEAYVVSICSNLNAIEDDDGTPART